MRLSIAALITSVPLALAGCGSTLPAPRTTPQPDDAFVEVPYPPPAAKPELVPDKPTKASVWIDGTWRWRRGRWIWTAGGWLEAPPGETYQRPIAKRHADGTLWFAKATWRDASGAIVRAPKILAPPPDEPSLDQGPAVPCPPIPGGATSAVAELPGAPSSPLADAPSGGAPMARTCSPRDEQDP